MGTTDRPEMPRGRHLICYRAGGALAPMFFVCGAEGHGLTFRRLTRWLPVEHPAYGVMLPGTYGDEPLEHSIEACGTLLASQILDQVKDGRVFLVGYSMGAAVAYEIARQLAESSVEVPAIISVDGFAPGSYGAEKPILGHVWAAGSGLLSDLRAYRATELRGRARQARLAVLRKRAVLRHRRSERLSASVLLVTTAVGNTWQQNPATDATYGWRDCVTGAVEGTVVSSLHTQVVSDDDAQAELSARICEYIARFD